MTSMVAKACSSTSTEMPGMVVQEKGSRNKRKFRADPPLGDPNKVIPLPANGCTNFEFSAEKFEIIPSQSHTNGCDTCCTNQYNSDALRLDLGLSCMPSEETETSSYNSYDADWNDLTESQLEELVLSNLDTIFKSAIKKIIASGYSEEVASKAILRSGLWYGCKDIVSNIVDNTLADLRTGLDIDPSRDHCFEDLQQMEKYILAELVCLLREVRPFFSTGDAMWCLLICDLNVSHACAMDSDPLGGFLGNVSSNGNSSISAQSQFRTEPKSSESNISAAYTHNCPAESRNMDSIHGGHSLQPEAPKVIDGHNLKPQSSFVLNGLVPEKECENTTSRDNEKPLSVPRTSQTAVREEKFVGTKQGSGITRREYLLRQKSIHFEKHGRAYGSKGTSRSGKLSSFSVLALDKKLRAVTDSTNVNSKNASFKCTGDMPQESVNNTLSMASGLSSPPTFGVESVNGSSSLDQPSISSSLLMVPVNKSPSLPVADTELSLSFPAIEATNCSYVGSSNDSLWRPHDLKDEMIMKLVPRVRELQNQLQEWTEWANQKVMQAACRLRKDKTELKALRQEKEETELLKKEKQTLEENTLKKLSEMENALRKASGQVHRANAAVRRLEVENVALRREMEGAKLHAAESAASCEELLRRENKTLVKIQSWEKQKVVFQEELAVEKSKLMQFVQELRQAKDVKSQTEAKWSREKKANDDLRTQAGAFRKEREQIEASTKSKEDTIKSQAETSLKKCKDDIKKLEKEISQLRLKTESPKIAALRRGIDGRYASKVSNIKNTPALEDSLITHVSRMMNSTGKGGVKRERECVMCLSEEMSVVFLPCAHQAVCKMCNELHQKQGMNDCPSCRSTIQQRVFVSYA